MMMKIWWLSFIDYYVILTEIENVNQHAQRISHFSHIDEMLIYALSLKSNLHTFCPKIHHYCAKIGERGGQVNLDNENIHLKKKD